MRQRLILIRGLPGAGKSTLAKRYGGPVFEADDYFLQRGVYRFNPTRLRAAHAQCQGRCRGALDGGIITVVAANTFTIHWEIEPYLHMADHFNADAEIVDLFDAGLSDLELHCRCIHDVPMKNIKQMRARWWRAPGPAKEGA